MRSWKKNSKRKERSLSKTEQHRYYVIFFQQNGLWKAEISGTTKDVVLIEFHRDHNVTSIMIHPIGFNNKGKAAGFLNKKGFKKRSDDIYLFTQHNAPRVERRSG